MCLTLLSAPPLMAGVPGADDLLGAGSSRKFLQKVVGQIQSPEVDQTPGDHRGQGRQAVRGQVQVGGPGQDVHEPVQFQPGQLQTAPTHTHSLSTDRHQPQEHMKVLCVCGVCVMSQDPRSPPLLYCQASPPPSA